MRKTQQDLPQVRVFFVKRVRTFAVRFSDVVASRMSGLKCRPAHTDTNNTNPSLIWNGPDITAFLRSDCAFLDLLDVDVADDLALDGILVDQHFPAEVPNRS